MKKLLVSFAIWITIFVAFECLAEETHAAVNDNDVNSVICMMR